MVEQVEREVLEIALRRRRPVGDDGAQPRGATVTRVAVQDLEHLADVDRALGLGLAHEPPQGA